jgi:hypothetical protein
VESCLCGVGGWWRKSKNVLGSLLLLAFFFFFGNVEDGFSWAFLGVYGPYYDCERRYLWEELVGLLS